MKAFSIYYSGVVVMITKSKSKSESGLDSSLAYDPTIIRAKMSASEFAQSFNRRGILEYS